jgi:choline dehydrogenase-like flavoprotein
VTLRSADPRDTPEIDFHYFDEGNDGSGADLQGVIDGVRFARRMADELAELIEQEELPGPNVQSREELADFIKKNAWGHHASCTCPIGPKERNGVLNGDFEVHGTRGLRVVDASVFPRIPGFFIVTSVFMVAEKAADVIRNAARAPGGNGPGRGG